MLGTLMLVLFLCLFATVPIALSLGISTLGVFATQFPSMPMANNLAQAMITSADSFPLMAIPFFMLVGTLMEKTGIARRLVDIASILTGDTPGGLGMAAIVASMFFAAISGSGPATAAAIGGIMLPAMIEQRYSRSYSVGIVVDHRSDYSAFHSDDYVRRDGWRLRDQDVHGGLYSGLYAWRRPVPV